MESATTKDKVLDLISSACTADNFQNYVLGTKKNGRPRAVYDIVRDVVDIVSDNRKKKEKKRKKDEYRLYLKRKKSSKGRKGKKKKYWKF